MRLRISKIISNFVVKLCFYKLHANNKQWIQR